MTAPATPGQARPSIERLKHRAEFLKVADSRRKFVAPGFVLQARPREADGDAIRVGFTATRKIGGAVVRNRARRRLRAAAAEVVARSGRRGFDYVLVARQGTLAARYADLVRDLDAGLARLSREVAR